MKIPAYNLFLMISSTLLALLLWLWVVAEERSEIAASVPLQYRNLPKGYEIVPDTDLVTSINAWVRGPRTAIKNLRPQDVSASVDLANVKPGEKHFELEKSHLRVPYGFTVLRIYPSRTKVKIEQVASRMVPVMVRLVGEPKMGYSVNATTVVPAQVEIRGPQSAVASVRHVVTDSIDVGGVNESRVETVNIGVDNSAVRLERTKEVKVSLKVAEIEDLLTLRIPVDATGTERSFRYNPKAVTVDLLGPKRLLSQIPERGIKAVLQLEGLKPGFYELTPLINLEGELKGKVSVHRTVPARIHVRIQ